METTANTLINCNEPRAHPAKPRKTLSWSISWLPALTLITTDLIVWFATFLVLSQLRLFFAGSANQLEWETLIIPSLVTILSLQIIGGYDRRTDMMSLEYATQHIITMFLAFGISTFVLYGIFVFGNEVKTSRLIFFLSFPIFSILTLFARRRLGFVLAQHHALRHFVLISDFATAASFERLYRKRGMPQNLKIYTTDATVETYQSNQPVTKGMKMADNLSKALAELTYESDGVIIGMPPSKLDPSLTEILAYVHFQHIPVYTLESFYEEQWQQVPVQDIEATWAFARGSLLARDSIYDKLKRLFDFLFALAFLILLSPLLLLIAILIRIDSPGSAIFCQIRVGRFGHPFTAYKFRTMKSCPDGSGINTTTKNDARITRIGRFLRRTRLDELPQLINVFQGDMSIIGPRAEWIKCVERYETQIAYYRYRHLVRPGITGWAQVNYPYGENEIDALEKLKYDLFYIRNYSFILDLAIVLKTIHVMLFARGQ
jgi:exopolysaccharide biosynthesis polyprenyl glycosylphosphotransferase